MGADDSNVYVYDDVSGGITCCGCSIYRKIVNFETSGEMIQHLDAHRAKGDFVPDYTYKEILEDYPELFALITGEED
jgi:hypothetical protein